MSPDGIQRGARLHAVYDGDDWLHGRIVLGGVKDSKYRFIMLTPHFVYEEDVREYEEYFRAGPR